MKSFEIEYRGYWIQVTGRSHSSHVGDYTAELRVTSDDEGAATRSWTLVDWIAEVGHDSLGLALEDGMKRGFAYVDALLG